MGYRNKNTQWDSETQGHSIGYRKTGVGEVSQEEKVGVRLPSGSPEKRCTVKLETSGGSARVSPVVHGHER